MQSSGFTTGISFSCNMVCVYRAKLSFLGLGERNRDKEAVQLCLLQTIKFVSWGCKSSGGWPLSSWLHLVIWRLRIKWGSTSTARKSLLPASRWCRVASLCHGLTLGRQQSISWCVLGSGKVKNDCFSQTQEIEDRRQMVCTNCHEMQKTNTRQK